MIRGCCDGGWGLMDALFLLPFAKKEMFCMLGIKKQDDHHTCPLSQLKGERKS